MDVECRFDVEADSEARTYAIVLKLRWASEARSVEVHLAKSDLAEALAQASRFEEEGLHDELEEPSQPSEASRPVAREVYVEKETVREIVKIRCRHCGSLFEEKSNSCPRCGAPT